MSSSLQAAIATIQWNDYASCMFIHSEGCASSPGTTVSVLTIVGYDYGKYNISVYVP